MSNNLSNLLKLSPMRGLKAVLLIVFLSAMFSQEAQAQRVALTTDVLEWAASTPNFSIESRLSRRITLDVSVLANPFRNYFGKQDLRLANLRVQPEVRYWFNRPLARHFVGLNATAGIYDLTYNHKRYKGDLLAIGARYGYSLVLSQKWSVVFSGGIGLGYVHGYYFRDDQEQPLEPNQSKIIPFPDLSVSFSYIFK